MTTDAWLWILHPDLAVVLMYPLIGMVVRLAWQTRQRRVAQVKHPSVVGRDHSDLGRWPAVLVVPPSCSSCFWGRWQASSPFGEARRQPYTSASV